MKFSMSSVVGIIANSANIALIKPRSMNMKYFFM